MLAKVADQRGRARLERHGLNAAGDTNCDLRQHRGVHSVRSLVSSPFAQPTIVLSYYCIELCSLSY